MDIAQVQQSNPNILVLLLILGLISGTALNSYILASNHLPMNLLGLLGYVEPCLMVGVSLIGEEIRRAKLPVVYLFGHRHVIDYRRWCVAHQT